METKVIDWINKQNQYESTRKKANRPLVTLAYAQSIDGSFTRKQGISTQISGKSSSNLTHRIRSIHEGIMIGSGTLLADDPRLNVRLVDGPDPIPIILDSHLRIPVNARILNSKANPIIFCSNAIDAKKRDLLLKNNAIINPLSTNEEGLLPLEKILEILHGMNISSVMVEGGPKLINSFIKMGLWNLAIISISPVWLGGYGLNQFQFEEKIALKDFECVAMDEDIFLIGRRE